jgi:hypothetical protein
MMMMKMTTKKKKRAMGMKKGLRLAVSAEPRRLQPAFSIPRFPCPSAVLEP